MNKALFAGWGGIPLYSHDVFMQEYKRTALVVVVWVILVITFCSRDSEITHYVIPDSSEWLVLSV